MWWPARSDSSANGTESGSESRIVSGWTSALELRRQDHVHENDRQQERPDETAERCLQLARRARRSSWNSRPASSSAAASTRRASRRSASAKPGATAARKLTCRCRSRRSMREGLVSRDELDQIVEPHQSAALARHIEPRDRRGSLRFLSCKPQLHVVVFVHRWHRGSARPRRRRRPSGAERSAMSAVSTPKSAARSRSISDAQLGLVQLERGVGVQRCRPAACVLSAAPRRSRPASRGRARAWRSRYQLPAADVERRGIAHGDAQIGEISAAARRTSASRRAACSCRGTRASGWP